MLKKMFFNIFENLFLYIYLKMVIRFFSFEKNVYMFFLFFFEKKMKKILKRNCFENMNGLFFLILLKKKVVFLLFLKKYLYEKSCFLLFFWKNKYMKKSFAAVTAGGQHKAWSHLTFRNHHVFLSNSYVFANKSMLYTYIYVFLRLSSRSWHVSYKFLRIC